MAMRWVWRTTAEATRAVVMALALMGAGLSVAVLAPAEAWAQNRDEEEEDDGDRVFSPDIGEIVQKALDAFNEERLDEAKTFLDRALAKRGINPYELGVVYQIRGNVLYQQEDVPGAIRDWETAMRDGNLNTKERLDLMFNIGQLYLVQGNYPVAIDRLEGWIAAGGDATDKVHLNLVAAYAEQGDYLDSLRHALLAYDKANPRERKHYDMLNFLYTELDRPRDRARILREMVVLFPTDESIWLSIAALYAQNGETRKAFEINKIMYLNGMLDEEKEIMRIVDYYSFYEVPYNGARILEREMNRGRVARNFDNYEKLARLYRQAREFGRAVDPLREAARRSADGILFRQLGEAFYSEGQLEEAEEALRQALDQGGLEKPGDVWNLIGATLYERDDVLGRYEAREQALEAYSEAAEYADARATAEGWITFINKEVETFRAREEFAAQVQRDEIRVACERFTRDTLIAGGFDDASDTEGDTADRPLVPERVADDPRFDGIDCWELVKNPERYFAAREAERVAAEDAALADSGADGEQGGDAPSDDAAAGDGDEDNGASDAEDGEGTQAG